MGLWDTYLRQVTMITDIYHSAVMKTLQILSSHFDYATWLTAVTLHVMEPQDFLSYLTGSLPVGQSAPDPSTISWAHFNYYH